MSHAGLTVTIDAKKHRKALDELLAKYKREAQPSNHLSIPALNVIYGYRVEMLQTLASTGTAPLWAMAEQHMTNDPFDLGSWQAAANRFMDDA